MNEIFNAKPGASLKGSKLFLLAILVGSIGSISSATTKSIKLPVSTKKCNETCLRCPEARLVLQQDVALPMVLVDLTISYMKHYKKVVLFEYNDRSPAFGNQLSVLYWDDQEGPTFSAVKASVTLHPESRLEVFRKKPEGGTFCLPPDDRLQLAAKHTWYYKITPPMWSLVISGVKDQRKLSCRMNLP